MDKPTLEQLWQQTPIAPPNWEAFAQMATEREVKKRNERNRVNFLLGGTIAFVAFIAFAYWPMQWHTLLGIVLTEASMLIYLWQFNRNSKTWPEALSTTNARQYLTWLRQDRQREVYLGRQLMTTYFLMLSTGILLYMWEFAQRMPGWYGWLAYAMAIGWFGVNWLVFRPRILKKREAATNRLIEQLEALQEQLT